MNTDDYFLKISEYCNFNLSCVNEVLTNKKKLRKVLGIENKKDLDNVWYELSVNFADYVYKNYIKFPKEELARFIVVNMCGYDFKCMLETLKEHDMLNMLDYLLDYWKKNYDIEKIVNDIIDEFSWETAGDLDDGDVFPLQVIAWLEFNRPEIGAFLAMSNDDIFPFILSGYFENIEDTYLYDYEEVFSEVPDDIVNKIREVVDGIYSRVEDRLKEIAKGIYDETLDLINNNPEYKIIGYEECNSYLCHLLGLNKIPLVHVEENTKYLNA
jgi:hypothetical protein